MTCNAGLDTPVDILLGSEGGSGLKKNQIIVRFEEIQGVENRVVNRTGIPGVYHGSVDDLYSLMGNHSLDGFVLGRNHQLIYVFTFKGSVHGPQDHRLPYEGAEVLSWEPLAATPRGDKRQDCFTVDHFI